MRELFTMWQNTRMIVLVAVSAAAYVAILLPFKGFVLVPGLTELRPGAAIPVVLSFLLGPAAAWGSGFGNIIADTLGGMLGPGSFFGFLGNFFYGFVPYRLWAAFMGGKNPLHSGLKGWFLMTIILITNCLVIASLIGWGAELLRLAPFAALGLIIAVNNFIASAAIGTPLLALLYGKLQNWGLLYHQILDDDAYTATATHHALTIGQAADQESAHKPRKTAAVAGVMLIFGAFVAFAAGLYTSGVTLQFGYGETAFAHQQVGTFLVVTRMLPGILIILFSVLLL